VTAGLPLLAILGAIALGAVSPGPSFVLVSRIAVARSRRDGLAAALGMGLGGAIFAALAVLGFIAMLTQVPVLYDALRLLGGFYLARLAWRIWRGAREPLAMPDTEGTTEPRSGAPKSGQAFRLGLLTQISNPKTAVVYAGIFAALLPAAPPGWVVLALPPLVFVVEAGWYAVVALAFSARRPRAAYLHTKTALDRGAALVLGVLGARLLLDAARHASGAR